LPNASRAPFTLRLEGGAPVRQVLRCQSSFPITVDQSYSSEVAFPLRGPQRQVFVDGVEVKAISEKLLRPPQIGRLHI